MKPMDSPSACPDRAPCERRVRLSCSPVLVGSAIVLFNVMGLSVCPRAMAEESPPGGPARPEKPRTDLIELSARTFFVALEELHWTKSFEASLQPSGPSYIPMFGVGAALSARWVTRTSVYRYSAPTWWVLGADLSFADHSGDAEWSRPGSRAEEFEVRAQIVGLHVTAGMLFTGVKASGPSGPLPGVLTWVGEGWFSGESSFGFGAKLADVDYSYRVEPASGPTTRRTGHALGVIQVFRFSVGLGMLFMRSEAGAESWLPTPGVHFVLDFDFESKLPLRFHGERQRFGYYPYLFSMSTGLRISGYF